MASKEKIDSLVDKHMKTLKIFPNFEEDTRKFVRDVMTHPAFNNPKYKWTLNDFELGKKLGHGKFGRVYLARENRTKYLVAIKTIIKKEIVENQAEIQVAREIEIQSHLKHHNILEMLAWFHDSHRIYLVLEFAGEGELYRHLQQAENGRFSEERSAKYIYQVADALEYCHQNCVIHRDIKPENLLLTIRDDVKVADFGWSVHSPTATRTTACGTLDYLPPEIVNKQKYKYYVDNWSLGILCFEFLHGYAPFESKTTKGTYERIREASLKFLPGISVEARDLISNVVQIFFQGNFFNQILANRFGEQQTIGTHGCDETPMGKKKLFVQKRT